jgi:hypothetical protein
MPRNLKVGPSEKKQADKKGSGGKGTQKADGSIDKQTKVCLSQSSPDMTDDRFFLLQHECREKELSKQLQL